MGIVTLNQEVVKLKELFGGLYTVDQFDFSSQSKEVEIMTCNRYVDETNLLEPYKSLPQFKLLMDCPTNSGKSKYVIETCLSSFDKFIYLADTVLLGQQIANKYKLPFHSADTPLITKPNQFVTLYDHVWKFAPEKSSDYVLIVDELHSVITQRGFRLETLKDLVSSFEMFDRIIGLTGTYVPCEGWNDWSKVKIKVENLPKHLVQFVQYEDELSTMVNLASRAVNENNHQVVIYLQNKSDKLKKLKKALQSKDISVVCVNADTTKGGEFDFLEGREIVLNEDFTEQVLITSYAQGYNIAPETAKEFTFIAEPNRLNVDVVQAMNRVRQGLKDVYVLSNADQPSLKYDEALSEYTRQEKEHARQVYKMAKEKNRSSNWTARYIKKEALDEVITPFGIDYFHLTFNVLERLKTKLAKDSLLLETSLQAFDLNTEYYSDQFDTEILEIEEEDYTLFLTEFFRLLELEKRLTGEYRKFNQEHFEPLEAYLTYSEVKSFLFSCIENGKLSREKIEVKKWELEFQHAKFNKSSLALKAILLQEIEEKFYPKGQLANTVLELSKAANMPLTPHSYLPVVKALFNLKNTSQRWKIDGIEKNVKGYDLTKK